MTPEKPAERLEGVVVDVPDEKPPEVGSEHVSTLPVVPVPSEDEPL